MDVRSDSQGGWFGVPAHDRYAALELGKVYEALGRHEEAKEQYETALALWRLADPVLTPKITEARPRLAGLGFQPRG